MPPPKAPELDLVAMLTGDVNRLRYITRHSTSLVLHRENVAEHSYYVALYAMFVCRWAREHDHFGERHSVIVTDMTYDRIELEVLRRCLIHDLDEARTGDFQRPFKHRSDSLHAALEQAAEAELTIIAGSIFPGDTGFECDTVNRWHDAKDNTTAGAIVAFADYLSVLSYLWAEVTCANLSVLQHYQTLLDYTHTFESSKYDVIRPLVGQAVALVHGIINGSENLRDAIKERINNGTHTGLTTANESSAH